MPDKQERNRELEIPTSPAEGFRKWHKKLTLSRKYNSWETNARDIINRYRLDNATNEDLRNAGRSSKPAFNQGVFNVLWSNTQILMPVLYNQAPVPVVRRRFNQDDRVARDASEMLERVLEFSLDSYNFNGVALSVVLDSLLVGRGIARVKYIPTIRKVEKRIPVQAEAFMKDIMDDAGKVIDTEEEFEFPEDTQFDDSGVAFIIEEGEEEVVYEEVKCEYVYWKDFRHEDARKWEDVTWIAYRSFMSREELVENFGAIGWQVRIDQNPNNNQTDSQKKQDDEPVGKPKATVWEIWDKSSRQQIFISEGLSERPLEVNKDPLGLTDFFPSPKPLYSFESNDSLVPIPEFNYYRTQADELNQLTSRIRALIFALRRRGFYDASLKVPIERNNEAIDNELTPIEDPQRLSEKGGINSVIQIEDISSYSNVLVNLYAQRDSVKREIFEITGISDIIRGDTNAQETAAAQKLKSRYASIRVSTRQREVQRFVRDLLDLKAQVIAENFSEETLSTITGLQVGPEIMELLKNQEPRNFAIDIETDSTIAIDKTESQEQVIEFVTAIGNFAQTAPVLAQTLGPQFTKELLMTSVREFKQGRRLEELLDQETDAIIQQSQQQQEQQPDPEIIKAQMEAQTAQMKAQLEAQASQQEIALRISELQLKAQIEQANLQLKQQELAIKASEANFKGQEANVKLAIEVDKLGLEEQKLELEAAKVVIEGQDPSKNVIVGV